MKALIIVQNSPNTRQNAFEPCMLDVTTFEKNPQTLVEIYNRYYLIVCKKPLNNHSEPVVSALLKVSTNTLQIFSGSSTLLIHPQ